MKPNHFLRALSLLALFILFLPVSQTGAQAASAPPPADMFQLPWDLGKAWVALDGIDNGSKRPASSSHNYRLGGAIDFAPRSNMVTGENTSNFWVTAAAAGTVIETSSCYLTLAHDNGWVTQYQFLGNIQVQLGDVVARNQRLAVIADGVRQKYCPGYQEINVPHLHFILRPSIVGATLAGWEVNYSPFWNRTTFTKGLITVGLFKPLLNVMDAATTPTPTLTPTATPTSGTPQPGSVLTLSKTASPQTYGQVGQTITYTFTITNTGAAPLGPAQFMINETKLAAPLPCGPADTTLSTNQTLSCSADYSITQADMSVASLTNIATASGAGQTSAPASATITNLVGPASPTPTLAGPFVSTVVDPQTIYIGETALATVSLNNVPAEGYTSAEFTCSFAASIAEVSNISVTDLFGPDAVVAINGPQNNSFIVAIAGSKGNKATTSGPAFTFSVKGLQVGQTNLGCEARVSGGGHVLTQISSAHTNLTVLSTTSTPTPNLTPGTPTVLPSACDRAEFIADVNIPPGTVMLPGTTFTKTWRLKNLGPCVWSTSYSLVFFYGDLMGAPTSAGFSRSVAVGETVDISLNMTAPNAPGSYRGYWMFRNANGQNFGLGPEATQPWFVDINVSGPTLPASPTPTQVPPSSTPTNPGGPVNSPTPTFTPIPGDWLTFTNLTYGFEFKYPPGGQIVAEDMDTYARIDLPFVQGTNLREKYLEVIVAENANPCRSPLASSSMLETSETVVINGITFLKETGGDGGAGHLHQWIAYSTSRNGACVSLDFVLHSLNAGNFPTPPPIFDYAAESAVFGQIVGTYMWLTSSSTPTATPGEPPIFTSTSTPTGSLVPTPTPISTAATLTGQVLAGKPVTVSLYDESNTVEAVTSVVVNTNGTFSLTAPAGTYIAVATASGFLSAQASVTIINGNITTLPTITLLAGDIDNNNVIDQFDALTIGMSYNTANPSAADLNNDGTINVLDLELLANNYRETGPTAWE